MRIAVFYFALFAATGVLIPFLPPYFRALGLTGKEIAVLGSLSPLLMIFVPPVWGFLADRLRRTTGLLKVACAGAAVTFAPLLGVDGFLALAAVLLVFAVFQTPLTALADTVALAEARRLGTDFSRLRLWGSVGFVAASYGFGAWLARGGTASDVIPLGLGLLVVTAFAAQLLRPIAAVPATPSLTEARRLAHRPDLVLFLLAAAIHWGSAAPYHLFFAVYFRDLALDPEYIGLGLGVAVAAEVAVMWAFRGLARRLPLFAILQVSFAVTALRWVLTGRLDSGPALVAVQALHGFTFGAWLVASMEHLERAVPEHLRATGRALFSAMAFGIGGIGGNLLAGSLYDLYGAGYAFRIAARVELLAPVVLVAAWWVGRRRSVALR